MKKSTSEIVWTKSKPIDALESIVEINDEDILSKLSNEDILSSNIEASNFKPQIQMDNVTPDKLQEASMSLFECLVCK